MEGYNHSHFAKASRDKKEYDHKLIEAKWQKKWQTDGLYSVADRATTEDGSPKENFYTLVEFPYPSGNLHIGHWYAFAVPDIFARFKRMQGFNVLYPIGFDSFGLPAENAAIKRKLDPREWTYGNIEYMSGQLRSMGNMFDWSRRVVTSDPEYYKWTQWLFIELFKKGLAYKKKGLVNWCPSCQTVLANEQVIDGVCERCGSEVTKKDLEQWYFKTTEYAERLLTDLEKVNWPESIKESQRNWIGRSEGAEFEFTLEAKGQKIESVSVFTTRADTLFGVTYIVLSPEHEVIEKLKSQISNFEEVEGYIKKAKTKTEIERTDAKKEKTGVELKGIKAVHPATGEEVPVWVADYVLAQYGTGAVMAVPAHDGRDFEFAKKYDLPVKDVVIPTLVDSTNPPREDKENTFRNMILAVVFDPKKNKYLTLKWKTQPWITFITGGVEEGENRPEAAQREILEETGYKNVRLVHSLGMTEAFFFAAHKNVNRKTLGEHFLFELLDETQEEIAEEERSQYELQWLTFEELCSVSLQHAEAKIILDRIKTGINIYTDSGTLINSLNFNGLLSEEAREKITEKYGVKKTTYKLRDWLLSRQRYWGCPIPVVYDPEGNPHPIPHEHLPWVLPTDDIDLTPKGTSPLGSSKELIERTENMFGKGWRPEVDTMDTFVDSSWYFLRYTDPHNDSAPFDKKKLAEWMPVKRYSGGAEHTTMHLLYARFFHKALFDLSLVNEDEPFMNRMNRGLILGPDGAKMSKSKGNVIDPDEFVEKVGSDTVKMYLAFIGPYNEVGQYPWDLGGIAGIRRFLEKIWKLQGKIDDSYTETPKVETKLHQTIKKVTEDVEAYKFNTAISQIMILVNEIEIGGKIKKETCKTILRLLAPFAPHITEELWNMLGNQSSIHLEKWPLHDPEKLLNTTVTYAIQIDGKTRGTLEVDQVLTEAQIVEKAQEVKGISERISDKRIIKTVFVLGRLVNFVLAKE